MIDVREETPLDHDAIRDVNRLAFANAPGGGAYEAALVDRLRADGLAIASLVAVEDGEVVGHVLFSDLAIETNTGPIAAAALAPMAVRPQWQRRGIGSALVRRGLDLCRDRGQELVVVLGHPAYYPRFGFAADLARRLRAPFTAGDAFMALELVPGVLQGRTGAVRYPAAFGIAS